MSFDVFDYPYTMTLLSITEGYNAEFHPHHPSSGVWIPPREVETPITGNLSSVTDAELQYLPESVRENGARLISVDADTTVSNGDHIRITEPDDTTTLWKVEKEKTTTNFLDIVGMRRRQYYISKCL